MCPNFIPYVEKNIPNPFTKLNVRHKLIDKVKDKYVEASKNRQLYSSLRTQINVFKSFLGH